MNTLLRHTIAWVAAFGFSQFVPAAETHPWANARLPANANGSVEPSQVLRFFSAVGSVGAALASNAEVSRGPITADVYARVAPATVVVHFGSSLGTGFLVDRDGWILTNHHVLENSGVHAATGAKGTLVHLGRMQDGMMAYDAKQFGAVVYKSSPEKDLALLKLVEPPAWLSEVEPVKLAAESPVVGADCVCIGHPRSGLLWTVRSGEIAGVGFFPQDRIEQVMSRLTANEETRQQRTAAIAAAATRKVVLSTCGINPGDSGGPLLNEQGELAGVTYAIPKSNGNEGISLDKFSYHIHVDEVREFLADRPAAPAVFVPSVWPGGLVSALVDSDGNGRNDSWMFAAGPDQKVTGRVLDVDENSEADLKADGPLDQEKRDRWEFEFAVQLLPMPRTFYDCDDNGQIDLILMDNDGDGSAELALTRQGDGWVSEQANGQRMFDADRFKNEAIRERFRILLARPQSKSPAQPSAVVPAAH